MSRRSRAAHVRRNTTTMKIIRGVYRASYESHSAWGRTPTEAQMRLVARVENTRLSVKNVVDAVAGAIIAPFTH